MDRDIEEQDPLAVDPVDRDGRRMGDTGGDDDGNRKVGCCERFHRSISKWMLPEELHEQYLERANCCPPPIFIILISIGELAVFIYYAVWKPQKQWVTLGEGIWNSPLSYKSDRREEAWRFVSYMFVHAGVEHILGNLVMQLLLGIPLELVHKGFEVGMVYMAGVLAGSLASSIFDPLSALVGASGGVYALIGGYFMNAVVNFREMIPVLGVFRIGVIVIIGRSSLIVFPPVPQGLLFQQHPRLCGRISVAKRSMFSFSSRDRCRIRPLQKVSYSRRWLEGLVCGAHRRRGGWDDHWLRVLQRLQPEAPEGPAFLALHSRLCSLPLVRCALQHLPFPCIIPHYTNECVLNNGNRAFQGLGRLSKKCKPLLQERRDLNGKRDPLLLKCRITHSTNSLCYMFFFCDFDNHL
uniref:rhomboid protease n=1 Tax=Oncorhynchus kisutch TaxID=8019 RepID=A0A8C7MBR2_ONCKI